MRIKEITVKNYGPIEDFYIDCGKIHLIYGKNEAGKTALVDAITETLFQKKSIFPHQDRFDKQAPSGGKKRDINLVVEHRGGKYYFPASGKSPGIEELMGLPHYHLAGLFIIRAGDLSLREGDKKWQDRVKEFLSGTPVRVERIKEKIEEEVGITATGEWSNRQPLRKKAEVEKKNRRKKELLEAIDRLEDIDQKQKTLRKKYREKQELEEKNKKIKLLRSYLLNRRVKKAFSGFHRQKVNLQNYERYQEEDSERWQKKERENRILLDKKRSCQESTAEIKSELAGLNKEKDLLQNREKKLTAQKDRAHLLSIFKDTRKLLTSKEDIAPSVIKLRFYGGLGSMLALSGIAVFTVFVLWLKEVNPGITILFSLMLGGGVYLLVSSYLIKRKELGVKKLQNSIIERAKQIWSEAEDIEEVLKISSCFDAEISQVEGKLDYISKEKEKQEEKLREKEKQLEGMEKDILELEQEIKNLRDKTGLSSASKLEEKIREKQNIMLDIQSKKDILREALGIDDPSVWEREAKKDVVKPDIEKKELAKEQEVEKQLSGINSDIQRLAGEVTSFTQGELGRLGVKEVTGMWQELKKIEDELSGSYHDRGAAFVARQVLGEVGKDMEQILLRTISDEKNGVSFYFNRITSGKYKRVSWQEGYVKVEDIEGKVYPVETLSSGTQDQLFFCLRLGILKRGLPEGSFILLDDAFLTSDTIRREYQVKMCKTLAQEGWQIFYFTVDEHIRDLFCRICGVESVVL